MKPSRVLSKIRRGERALGVCLHLTDPSVYEMTSLLGFDAIWMDLEHHGYSVETAGHLMRAARIGGTDIVARPGKGEFMRLSRLLESRMNSPLPGRATMSVPPIRAARIRWPAVSTLYP